MTGGLDSHVHIWLPDGADYSWLAEVPELRRPFQLGQVLPELSVAGITSVVLVQAADDVADTESMLRAAQEHPEVAGVVAWVPLARWRQAQRLLDRWAGHPVVGVRHLVHRQADPNWLLDPQVDQGLAMLADRGLSFDVCAETPHLLGLVPRLAERHPALTLVVDHLGKPPLREYAEQPDGPAWQRWAGLLAAAAAPPTVVAKVSGLNTTAPPGWTAADLRPAVEHALAVFGPDRLLYGGDWPFALLAAESYSQVWHGVRDCLDRLPAADLEQVLCGTARRAYRLDG